MEGNRIISLQSYKSSLKEGAGLAKTIITTVIIIINASRFKKPHFNVGVLVPRNKFVTWELLCCKVDFWSNCIRYRFKVIDTIRVFSIKMNIVCMFGYQSIQTWRGCNWSMQMIDWLIDWWFQPQAVCSHIFSGVILCRHQINKLNSFAWLFCDGSIRKYPFIYLTWLALLSLYNIL